MNRKINTIAIISSILFSGCNLGTPASSDVQSTNNSTQKFSLASVVIGCKTISANGGKCKVVVTHSAADSKYQNQSINLNLPNNYKISSNDCKATQNKSASCTITINANLEIRKAEVAKLMINNHSDTIINFTLGRNP